MASGLLLPFICHGGAANYSVLLRGIKKIPTRSGEGACGKWLLFVMIFVLRTEFSLAVDFFHITAGAVVYDGYGGAA